MAVVVSFSSFSFPSEPINIPEPVEVKDVRQSSSKGYTRIVIDLTGPVEFSSKRLSYPDRLYFDLKNAKIANEINTAFPVGDGILKTVRAGQFDQDTVRVVLDLEEVRDFKTLMLDDPARLVIDIYGKRPVKTQEMLQTITIVIDPGHGGHDPGATGPKGLYEKDVVLDIALKLKNILLNKKNINVFLTRETDIFIRLEDRPAIAMNKNADLFISIHANASATKIVRGIETYFLNWSDEEGAIRVAARENEISLKTMKEHVKKSKNYVDIMLDDLNREFKRDGSLYLAGYIQKSIVSTLGEKYSHVNDLGVKGGPFFVLYGARIPSILVETSFISNPIEERLLKKEAYKEYIARAIAKGIDTYMASMSPEEKMARYQSLNGREK